MKPRSASCLWSPCWIMSGIWVMAVCVGQAAEPLKQGLVIIEGPRLEVRRYLPVQPRPEPQGYASGLLSPHAKSAIPAGSHTRLYSVYGQGSSRIKVTQPQASATAEVHRAKPISKEKPAVEIRRAMPARMDIEVPAPAPAPPRVEAPVAERLRPGYVRSPFPPHAPLDVQGLSTGTLVKDPVSGKLFRVP